MFDLSKYMTAEERIELFKADNPEMRYDTEHGIYGEFIWVKAKVYRFFDDPTPLFTGLAMESIKTQFAMEKAETSAYARAITNSGNPKYSTTKEGEKAPRANRAEMEKVARVENDAVTVKIEADLSNDWEGFLANEPKVTTLAQGVELVQQSLAATVSQSVPMALWLKSMELRLKQASHIAALYVRALLARISVLQNGIKTNGIQRDV